MSLWNRWKLDLVWSWAWLGWISFHPTDLCVVPKNIDTPALLFCLACLLLGWWRMTQWRILMRSNKLWDRDWAVFGERLSLLVRHSSGPAVLFSLTVSFLSFSLPLPPSIILFIYFSSQRPNSWNASSGTSKPTDGSPGAGGPLDAGKLYNKGCASYHRIRTLCNLKFAQLDHNWTLCVFIYVAVSNRWLYHICETNATVSINEYGHRESMKGSSLASPPQYMPARKLAYLLQYFPWTNENWYSCTHRLIAHAVHLDVRVWVCVCGRDYAHMSENAIILFAVNTWILLQGRGCCCMFYACLKKCAHTTDGSYSLSHYAHQGWN